MASAEGGAVLELGTREYFLCHQLDGHTGPGEVAERYEQRFGDRLPVADVEAFIRQLGEHGLLNGVTPSSAPLLSEFLAPEGIFPAPRFWLGNGNRFFAYLAHHLRFCFTPVAHAVAIALVGLAVVVFARSWSDYFAGVQARLDIGFLLTSFVCASLIPSIRMLAHGTTARRYGAQVNDAGILFFYYVSPSFFCDLSSAAALRERWQRMWVIGTGLYAQVVLWAVATLGWFVTAPQGSANTWWLALSLTAGAGLLLTAANPLVKLQGYFLLATWLEFPRLWERSVDMLHARVAGRPPSEPATARERRVLMAYGLLCTAYVVIVVGGVLFWVMTVITQLFDHGGGAAGALGVAVFAAQRPLTRSVEGLRRRFAGATQPPGRRRWLWRLLILLVIVAVLQIPYPYETGGPFTLIPSERTQVHNETSGGRIVKVFVSEGDFVKAHQPIAQIDAGSYERNVAITEAQLEADEHRLTLLYKDLALLANPPNIETIRGLEAEIRRLQAVLADNRRQLELTTLRAPMEGRVTTPLIEQAVGRYVKEGDLVATVEQARAVRVEIQVPEADTSEVRIGAPVKVVAWAYPMETFAATVREIAPIAVPPPGSVITSRSVRVVAEIANPDLRLKSQLTGYAKIKTEWIPVWLVLSRLLIRWFAVQVWYWLP